MQRQSQVTSMGMISEQRQMQLISELGGARTKAFVPGSEIKTGNASQAEKDLFQCISFSFVPIKV